MDLIKQLREKTNCGISDCKAALEEVNGDLDKAAEILRKKGIAKAAKRAGRETNEGIILAGVNNEATEGYMIEMNSETDFVARNDSFQSFARQIFNLVKTQKPAALEELMALPLNGGNVQEQLEVLSGTIGEKLNISHAAIFANARGTIASYIHAGLPSGALAEAGGKIGVLVSLDQPGQSALAEDIAMQIAAADPKYLNIEEAQAKGAEAIAKEKEIYLGQLKAENKPEQMWDKIIEGKLQKYYQEVCLMEQEYIKDDKRKVKEILGEVKVIKFIRYSL